MHPITLIPSGRFLLNSRFEKVVELAAAGSARSVTRAILRAAAGDPFDGDAELIATGAHLRSAETGTIVATVIGGEAPAEEFAHQLAAMTRNVAAAA